MRCGELGVFLDERARDGGRRSTRPRACGIERRRAPLATLSSASAWSEAIGVSSEAMTPSSTSAIVAMVADGHHLVSASDGRRAGRPVTLSRRSVRSAIVETETVTSAARSAAPPAGGPAPMTDRRSHRSNPATGSNRASSTSARRSGATVCLAGRATPDPAVPATAADAVVPDQAHQGRAVGSGATARPATARWSLAACREGRERLDAKAREAATRPPEAAATPDRAAPIQPRNQGPPDPRHRGARYRDGQERQPAKNRERKASFAPLLMGHVTAATLVR